MAKDLQEGRMSLTHANAMLAEHNRYIETVLDNITTGVITLDADGRIRTMNKAASSIFDAQPERLEGRNPAEFLPRSYSNIFVSMLKRYANTPSKIGSARKIFCLGIGAGSSYCTRLRSPGLAASGHMSLLLKILRNSRKCSGWPHGAKSPSASPMRSRTRLLQSSYRRSVWIENSASR